jgi:hypothetical protein
MIEHSWDFKVRQFRLKNERIQSSSTHKGSKIFCRSKWLEIEKQNENNANNFGKIAAITCFSY